MKKIMLAIGLCLGVISGVYADGALDQLNLDIQKILSPYQNENTSAQLVFSEMEIDKDRTNKVAMNAYYKKVGSQNTVELKIDNLAYNYGDGKSPTTVVKASLGVDITKVFSPFDLNQFMANASEFIESIAADYTRYYGEAASVKSVVTSTTKDEEGNYIGLTALIAGNIDLDKLPEWVERKDVFATNMAVSVAMNLKTGFSIEAFIVSNPEFYSFNDDESGLKEFLEALLAQDSSALEVINEGFMRMDAIAAEIVEYTKEFKSAFLKFFSK